MSELFQIIGGKKEVKKVLDAIIQHIEEYREFKDESIYVDALYPTFDNTVEYQLRIKITRQLTNEELKIFDELCMKIPTSFNERISKIQNDTRR